MDAPRTGGGVAFITKEGTGAGDGEADLLGSARIAPGENPDGECLDLIGIVVCRARDAEPDAIEAARMRAASSPGSHDA